MTNVANSGGNQHEAVFPTWNQMRRDGKAIIYRYPLDSMTKVRLAAFYREAIHRSRYQAKPDIEDSVMQFPGIKRSCPKCNEPSPKTDGGFSVAGGRSSHYDEHTCPKCKHIFRSYEDTR